MLKYMIEVLGCLTTLMTIVYAQEESKVKIDVYLDAYNPVCKKMILGSFGRAYEEEGFTDMIDMTFWSISNNTVAT